MRFFKRRSPEPPELVRLWRLPAEVGALHGEQQLAMLAPPLHRAAVSGSPTATLVRRLQQRRECELAKEAMALSSEARGAGGPVGVVSPSSVPLCCFVEATGAARTATPPGSAKLKRGFAFSRVGRKPCVGPHKYSLPPTPMSLDRSSPCLVEWPQRLATFTQPLRLALPDLLASREASRSVECLQERDDGGFFSECPEREASAPQRSSQQRLGGGVLRKTSSRMYRSRSTSALVIEASLHDVDVVMDQDDLDGGAVMTVGRAAGRYRRDCFDDAVVIDAVSGCKNAPCSEDGSTASTASTAGSCSGRGAPPSPPLEEDVGIPGASDTASLASSTQHRSDESGYESDGTKNGAEDSPNEDGPVTATGGANFKQHVQRVEPKANGGMQTPRITSTEPMSLPFINDATPTMPVAPVPTTTPPTPSTLSQRRASTQEGSNVQRLAAALLQRISLQSPSGGSKGSDCCKQEKPRSECSKPHHQGASYDCKSLRCKTQSLFSVLRRGDSPQHSIAPASPDAESSPRSERSATVPTQNSGSKLEQFRAWTLDRKLLRNRWKKSPSNSTESSRGIGCTFGSPILSRACSQEQSLRDEGGGGGVNLSQPMLKSAASWTNVCAGNDGVKENGGREGRLGRASVGDLGCRSIGDVCGSLDLGPRASSTTDLRRRMWLEAHLEGGAGRQLQQQQQQRRLSEAASVRSVPDGARVLAVRLAKDSRGELGVYIKGKCGPDGAVLGYVVADLEQDGPAASGQLRKGDELLVINGHQVQGVEIEEARQLLATPDQVVHLLVARQEDVEEECSEDTLTASPSPCPSRLAEPHRVPAERRASISHPGAAANYNTIPEVSEDGEKDNQPTQQYSSGVLCTLPRRPRHHAGSSSSSGGRSHGMSSNSELLTVTFVKGPGRGALGFSVVGGRDSPRGALGIYVRRLFPGGQAEGLLREGDQLVSLNGEPFEGLSHAEAIAAFKRVRQGELVLRVARRPPKSSQVSKSCCNLDSMT
ncbi:uncharacterized protein LOC144172289 isoform X2 [Haemaphysalis longicornis]